MSKDDVKQIASTYIFKTNDIVSEGDLWLQFRIRKLIRGSGLSTHRKAAILNAELDKLREDELDASVQSMKAGKP